MFQALVLDKSPGFSASVREVDEAFLPEGDVTIAVQASTLNYKDGLAITNKSPVVRSWPMVAGIDGSGTVLESSAPGWKKGDA
ncbi:MAG: alcohol dehydrogenase catalytic domain-containing protein, partial [Ramlibacter sp.]